MGFTALRSSLLLLVALVPSTSQSATPNGLTTIDAVRNLSPKEAAAGTAVTVQGTVTYVNKVWDTLYIQDDGVGIYAYSQEIPPVAVGDLVRVQGLAAPGSHCVRIELDSLEQLGTGPLPDPVSAGSYVFHPVLFDAARVEINGVVRHVSTADGQYCVALANGQRRVIAYWPQSCRLNFDAPDFIGRTVKLRGVWCVKRQSIGYGFELFVADCDDVEVGDPAVPDERNIESLGWIGSNIVSTDLVKVRATVIHRIGNRVFVADETGETLVQLADANGDAAKRGDVVEVEGFVAWDLAKPYLEDASLQLHGPGASVVPVDVKLENVAAHVGKLIRVEGTIRDEDRSRSESQLLIRDGQNVVRARPMNPDSTFSVRTGDRVMIQGALWASSSENANEFDLFLDSAPIVTGRQETASPGWWLFVVLGMALGVVSALIWARFRRSSDHRLQQHILGRLDELSHVARINTLGDMVAALSHELNQPLASIANYAAAASAQLDKHDNDADPRVGKCLHGIEDEANRAGDTIRRLKNLVRRKGPERTWVDLNELIRETVDLFKTGQICSSSLIQLNLEPGVPTTLVDAIQTQQVLLNLLSNAHDATQGVEDAPRIVVTTRCTADNYVQVIVEDNGSGLKGNDVQAIFEPYYTTKQQGTGLGLSISRAIVESHGGVMKAELAPERGCRIQFLLPLDQGRQPNK